MKKTLFILLIAILLCCHVTASFALPAPESAHYPRCGELTLSSQTEINNTYAFRATGKNDSSVVFEVQGGYAQEDSTAVSVQMFVINRWGNWVAFGKPKTLILNTETTVVVLDTTSVSGWYRIGSKNGIGWVRASKITFD